MTRGSFPSVDFSLQKMNLSVMDYPTALADDPPWSLEEISSTYNAGNQFSRAICQKGPKLTWAWIRWLISAGLHNCRIGLPGWWPLLHTRWYLEREVRRGRTNADEMLPKKYCCSSVEVLSLTDTTKSVFFFNDSRRKRVPIITIIKNVFKW